MTTARTFGGPNHPGGGDAPGTNNATVSVKHRLGPCGLWGPSSINRAMQSMGVLQELALSGRARDTGRKE
jgi:hypothetical protein